MIKLLARVVQGNLYSVQLIVVEVGLIDLSATQVQYSSTRTQLLQHVARSNTQAYRLHIQGSPASPSSHTGRRNAEHHTNLAMYTYTYTLRSTH